MTISRMCDLGHVSRAGLYRFDPGREQPDNDLELRSAIQRIALEFPCYGRPRITEELNRRGWKVNHKRVARILREDNLLCLCRKKFVTTTDSRHGLPVYPNLARDMELTRINELWIADITYIRLETEFVHLAVVLDAYSRRVIGWALDRTLEDDLAIAALQMAFDRRKPQEGLTHHSDRGVQYASHDYTALLKDHGVTISMSRKGNPYDNAFCESFMKTLKTKRSIGRIIATWPMRVHPSSGSLKRFTTASVCTRHWTTVRRLNLNSRRRLFLLQPRSRSAHEKTVPHTTK